MAFSYKGQADSRKGFKGGSALQLLKREKSYNALEKKKVTEKLSLLTAEVNERKSIDDFLRGNGAALKGKRRELREHSRLGGHHRF